MRFNVIQFLSYFPCNQSIIENYNNMGDNLLIRFDILLYRHSTVVEETVTIRISIYK